MDVFNHGGGLNQQDLADCCCAASGRVDHCTPGHVVAARASVGLLGVDATLVAMTAVWAMVPMGMQVQPWHPWTSF